MKRGCGVQYPRNQKTAPSLIEFLLLFASRAAWDFLLLKPAKVKFPASFSTYGEPLSPCLPVRGKKNHSRSKGKKRAQLCTLTADPRPGMSEEYVGKAKGGRQRGAIWGNTHPPPSPPVPVPPDVQKSTRPRARQAAKVLLLQEKYKKNTFWRKISPGGPKNDRQPPPPAKIFQITPQMADPWPTYGRKGS